MSGNADDRAITGIHHVTAIASDPQPNIDFYVRFLGLRLVKQTVNFDDPETYHFYYGDEIGRPGTILTFFPWPGARRGRHGVGQVTLTSFAIPEGSSGYWVDRARRFGFDLSKAIERFGRPVLHVTDPDGLAVELIEDGAPSGRPDGVDTPAEAEVCCLHSATLAVADPAPTLELLTGILGFRELGRDANRIRLEAGEGGPSRAIDLVLNPNLPRALGGAGTVHHIAFRTEDDEQQLRWQAELLAAGYHVSPVMDRNYFHSIYFREPGGILFEIATDQPGFLVDESADELGGSLKLPAEYEPRRQQIESVLPPITLPASGVVAESY